MEKSKLATFIHNFIFGWVQELGKHRNDIHSMHHVRNRMDRNEAMVLHGEAFHEYCEHYGFNVRQIRHIYKAAFHWRKGENKSVHIFEMPRRELIAKMRWFEQQKASADHAATAAAVLKAAAASPLILHLDTSTTDLPLIYWAMKYEADEALDTELAEIAHGT